MTQSAQPAPGDLIIAGNTSAPAIACSWEQGTVRISGESYPDDTRSVFRPLMDWITAFLAHGTRPLRVETELSYLNTSSIKAMMDILDLLEQAHQDGHSVSLDWHYDTENERALEVAEEFREDISFPFRTLSLGH